MDPVVPETKVLAIASHVVYGHVGNTMAAFVMQSMGCDVSALNTVHFSNHTGYGQFKGTKSSAEAISDIYDGLKQSYLTDFDAMLTGYAPNAAAVQAIGAIARDLKLRASTRPGSFFWALDPVMGDEGRLYVDEDVVPVYKRLLQDADLILPNQFELELLSDVTITSAESLVEAMTAIHSTYRIPHVVVTSIHDSACPDQISIIGSTARSDCTPRLFRIRVPKLDCYFSGTGDMFAALTLVRLREAAVQDGLLNTRSWMSPDTTHAEDLPLARAAEKVLGSMQLILEKTMEARDAELETMGGPLGVMEKERESEKRLRLRKAKAAEVRIVRHLRFLYEPSTTFKAVAVEEN